MVIFPKEFGNCGGGTKKNGDGFFAGTNECRFLKSRREELLPLTRVNEAYNSTIEGVARRL